jgi:ATP-binding cassette subfamily C (CFTR/MRP) protein 4
MTEVLLLDENPESVENMSFEKTEKKLFVKCDHLSCSYPKAPELALSDINFELIPGELLTVVGQVGSGKTTLLNLVLKELEINSGIYLNNMKIAFAPQEPWIFEGSVRDNILLGREFYPGKYETILHASCLKTDLANFQHGDQTIVGDKGTTLSGGQKSRIGLARAIYSNADLYLLDDPLF